jgi:hypothetical protein
MTSNKAGFATFVKPVGIPAKPIRHQNPKQWRRAVEAQFVFAQWEVKLLDCAEECLEKADEALRILKAEGLTLKDGTGTIRKHPCLQVLNDSQLRFVRIVRELRLSEQVPESRPPALRR